GLYKPGGNANTNRTISFAMKAGVAIYGGFTGTETQLSQLPTVSLTTPSSTTLSGEIGTVGNSADNSNHVISNPTGLTTTAILDGFVITGGNADGATFPDNSGGGMYNSGSGGGQVCSPLIRNCLFQDNNARFGGAIHNNGFSSGNSSPTLTNCSFQANTASSVGGAMYNDGRSSGSSSPSLTNCSFQNNRASGPGGALANDGVFFGNSSPILVNCIFQTNNASSGGALSNAGSATGNSSPTLINCSFQSNSATQGGGLINSASSNGISNPVLTNCTFQSNSATTAGGAIYNFGVASGNLNPTLTNCVLWNNGGTKTFFNDAASVTVRYSLLEAAVTSYTSGLGNLTTTNSPFASSASVALNACSPAINAGDPSSATATAAPYSVTALPATDLAGNPRVFGDRVDMGAVEFGASPGPLSLTLTAAPSLTVTTGNAATLTAATSPLASSYSWSSGQSTAAIAVSVAGTYSVTATPGICSSVSSVVVTVSAPPCGTVVYVTPNGAGLQNGTSWANALNGNQLQLAITTAASCGSSRQVWVAGGLYKPGGNANTNRSISFQMANNVAIYGGFAENETALSSRILTASAIGTPTATTLSGDIGAAGNASDNSLHVFNHPASLSLNNTARLDGFVITGGNANGSSLPDNVGGAMYNNSNSPSLTNCSFLNHNATTNGGAIYNTVSSRPNLNGCSFLYNTATTSGGGIYNDISTPMLTNCSFLYNTASFNGGAVANFSSNSLTLTNCSFLNNTANSLGGAIRNNGSSASLTNCVLFGNGGANTISNVNSSSLTAAYTLFEPSVTGYTSGGNNLTTGTPSATSSPFASTATTRLAVGSPAINAGDPATTTAMVGSTDLAGNPRIIGGRIDMGAVEVQDEIFTVKDGNWNDPTVWNVNRLPQLGDRARLKHTVTIPASYLGFVTALLYDPASRLMYGVGGRLQMVP
ncbi:MAG: hypothetical protein LH609_10365, partial [Rudanella sp.]|nr:hypothetical protein [Rudanella sp.]